MLAHPVRLTTLTETDADALDRELDALAAVAAPDLALDLSAVRFLSSTALARFVRLDRDLRAKGGRLSLVNLRPAVFLVFALSRLDRALDIRAA